MKKFFVCIVLLFNACLLCACSGVCDCMANDTVKMTAVVQNIGEKIEVDVLESEYTSGVHWVITSDQTEFLDESGNIITKNDLNIGDILEIYYSGQVMMSYPPQIVAVKIVVKK